MDINKYLTAQKRQNIVEAITQAERVTTGEIRVHVARKCRGDVLKKAIKTFNRLEMCNTRYRNGVLIFIAFKTLLLSY